jgi:hypothetical protein
MSSTCEYTAHGRCQRVVDHLNRVDLLDTLTGADSADAECADQEPNIG